MFHRDFLNNLFFGEIVKKRARWKLSLSSPSWPSLYRTLLVLLIVGGLQEGDRSVPVPPCPARVHLSPLSPGTERGRPSPPSYGEAVSRNGGILFVEKQATVAGGLRERANRSPCAGLITACAALAAVPSLLGGPQWGEEKKKTEKKKNECHCHFPVSRFLALPFLAVWFWNIFSVALLFFPLL